ncbi:MAG: hypothetical protein HY902_06775, partial [Deltaproteobacteria bacterium]|nr:hypothetical protein [Deltaproteobacteria bacterium]
IAPWPQDESGTIDVFGSYPTAEIMGHGQTLLDLIAAVRAARTAGKIGGGRPLQAIHLRGDLSKLSGLQLVQADWLAASRAEGFDQQQPDGLDWVAVGETGVELAIVPAPQEPAPQAS